MLKPILVKAAALALGVAQYALYLRWEVDHGRLLMLLVGSVLLVWFPEQIGGMLGWFGGRKVVDQETPGCVVSAVGWIGLVVFVPITFWLYTQVAS